LLMAAPLAERPFSKTQLFCSNLPWSVNGKMLRQAFEKHGEVIDAFVAYNGRSSRGFGYVTFKEPSGAATALQVASVNGVSLGDDDRSREIRVEMARERPGPRPEPRDRSERTPRDSPGDRGDRTPRNPREGESRGRTEDSGGRGRGRGRAGREGDGEGRAEGRSRRPRSSRGRGSEGRNEDAGLKREQVDSASGRVASEPIDAGSLPPAVEESSES